MEQLIKALLLNNVWDFGYRIRKLYPKTLKSQKIPNYCPFHKEFLPYFKQMKVGHIIDKYNIQCTSRCMCFQTINGSKSHSVGLDDFWHTLLIFIICQMYEGIPSKYGPTKVIPQNKKDNLSSDSNSDSTSNSFHVTR